MKKINIPEIKKPCFNRRSIPANIVFATNIINLSSRLKAKTLPFCDDRTEKMDEEEYSICESMLEQMTTSVTAKINTSNYDGTKCAKASDESIKHLKNFSDPVQFFRWLKYTRNTCADGFGAWKNVSIADRAVVIDIINDGISEHSKWAMKNIEKAAEEKKEESNGQ